MKKLVSILKNPFLRIQEGFSFLNSFSLKARMSAVVKCYQMDKRESKLALIRNLALSSKLGKETRIKKYLSTSNEFSGIRVLQYSFKEFD